MRLRTGYNLLVSSWYRHKVSLMLYSKITTKTIDDSVPTLGRERTNIERKKVGLPSLEEEEKGAESYMYAFHSTSRKSDVPTILKGNPTSEYIYLPTTTTVTSCHTRIPGD